MYKKCSVIAELCGNHMGKTTIAAEMIKSAKLCGADYIKFQKRDPELAVPQHMHNSPHPCPIHAFGETYLEHRKFLEFSIDQHRELKALCDDIGIGYSSSVWDTTSAYEITELNPDFIKVGSPSNNNFEVLDILYNNYRGNVHISTGMTTKTELDTLFEYVHPFRDRTVIYLATSEYPVPFDKVYLLELLKLKSLFPHVGFSGHHLGIAIDMLAYGLGATFIERHFTLDRTWKGTDHSASLEPNGLNKLCRDLKSAYSALTYKTVDLTEAEKLNRSKLKIIK